MARRQRASSSDADDDEDDDDNVSGRLVSTSRPLAANVGAAVRARHFALSTERRVGLSFIFVEK